MSKVYRAFFELDPFTDEQCVGFVRSTRRSALSKVLFTLLPLLAGFVSAGVVIGLGVLIQWLDAQEPYETFLNKWFGLVMALVIALIAGAGGLAFLFVRDRLLRRGIRRVLATRGSCAACGYGLTGIPVQPDGMVRCPECAFAIMPDEAAGEVQTTPEGQRLFMPSPTYVKAGLHGWTPAQYRRFWKRVGWSALGLVGLLLAVAGTYEGFIRWQAGVAKRERPGPQAFVDVVLARQPPGVREGDPNAWDAFYRVLEIMGEVDDALWRSAATGAGAEGVYPDFSALYDETPPVHERQREQWEKGRELAARLIPAYREAGLYAKLDEMASCRLAVRPCNMPPGAPMAVMMIPELGQARNLARINAGRMGFALPDGDMREWVSAYETMLAMTRMLLLQPTLIETLTGMSIEALAFVRLRDLIATRPDAATIEAIAATYARQRVDLPPTMLFEGERLFSLDTLGWVFEDPSRVRFGRYSPGLQTLFGTWGASLQGRLGTYRQNRELFERMYDEYDTLLNFEPVDRLQTMAQTPESSTLANILMPALSSAVMQQDIGVLRRRAIIVMLALERHRLVHGAYPDSLADLVFENPRDVIDPWSGRAFGYRGEGGGYVLYGVGADGTDDGGTTFDPPDQEASSLRVQIPGRDYLIHRQPPAGDQAKPE